MVWKVGIGLVLAFLVGCGQRDVAVTTPDSATYEDGTRAAAVGETHRLEAYVDSGAGLGDADEDSYDCDRGGAAVVSSDPSIVTVGRATFQTIEAPDTEEDVTAMIVLYHAIAPGTATLTATCDGISTDVKVIVAP